MPFVSLFFLPQPFFVKAWFLNVISAIRHFKRELGRHVRSVHEKQRHKCSVCMKLLFTRKYTLTKHDKLHTRVIITIYAGQNIVGDLIVGFNIVITH